MVIVCLENHKVFSNNWGVFMRFLQCSFLSQGSCDRKDVLQISKGCIAFFLQTCYDVKYGQTCLYRTVVFRVSFGVHFGYFGT